jgi:hypothetical protein
MQVVVGAEARVARIHGSICHELAHILIDRFGLRQSERAANYLAARVGTDEQARYAAELAAAQADLDALDGTRSPIAYRGTSDLFEPLT